MTDNQAKLLALSIVGKWFDPMEEMFKTVSHAMAVQLDAEFMRRMDELVCRGLGVPQQFLVLDSVTTADEVRQIEHIVNINHTSFGLILDGPYVPPLVSSG
jgi:hypothetical protein